MQNRFANSEKCFLDKLQEIFRSDVILLNVSVVIVFVVIIVLILLINEVIEDFLELMILLLECGLDFVNEGVEMNLIVIQMLLKFIDEQRRENCFDDIIILNNHRLRSLTR